MDHISPNRHLFDGFTIATTYMIVDRESFSVMTIADRFMDGVAGRYASEVDRGALLWSREPLLHQIEFKTNGPVLNFDGIENQFLENLAEADRFLVDWGGRLCGGGMHPFMDPRAEARSWPHGDQKVYDTIDRIFTCSQHGWANHQGVRLGLPFADDEEFGRLHAAIRLVLPIIPALAAASPILDTRLSGIHDTRLELLRDNAPSYPSVNGQFIPEPVFTMDEYREVILERIYTELAAADGEGVLREEWINGRGAIARFGSGTIEIRMMDAQESPKADLAVAAAVIGVVRLLAHEIFAPRQAQQLWKSEPLQAILLETIRDGEEAVISNAEYLKMFGIVGERCRAGELWKYLVRTLVRYDTEWIAPYRPTLEYIIANGTLSTRILKSLEEDVSRPRIHAVYNRIAECLDSGRMLEPPRV